MGHLLAFIAAVAVAVVVVLAVTLVRVMIDRRTAGRINTARCTDGCCKPGPAPTPFDRWHAENEPPLPFEGADP
jgi:hypothetical protein